MNPLRTIAALLLLLSPAALAQDSLTLRAPAPPPPAYVGASYSGAPGPASYYYWVSAVYPGGESGVAGPAPVRGAANTLSGSNTVSVSWSAAFGATSYNVIRTLTPVFQSNCSSCLLASGVTATTTADTGAALGSYAGVSAAAPATGGLAVNVRDYASPRLEVRLNGQAVANFDSNGLTGGVSGSVTVRESDGSPSVNPTTILEALTPDLVITDEGGGVARIALGTTRLPLSGGTLTGQLVADNLGIEFEDSDTNPACSAGNYNIFADLSETTLKKCINGTVSDLDTGGSPGTDSITTDELDDDANPPVVGDCVVVASGGLKFDYSNCLISGDPNVVTPTDAATLENKLYNSPALVDDTPLSRVIPNDASTGTTVNHTVKIQDDSGEEAVIATTSNTDGIIGVAVEGAGTTGSVKVAKLGEAQLDMDGACDLGDWVIASVTFDGEGHCQATWPTGVQVLGRATQTIGAAGLADVELFPYAKDTTVPADASVTVEKLENDAKTYHDCQTLVDFGTAIPDTADVPSLWGEFPFAMTLTKVWCEVDANSASINLQRDDGSAANVLSANLVCDTGEQDSCASGCDVDTIQDAEDDIAVGNKIDFVIASVSGALNRLNVCISGVIQ